MLVDTKNIISTFNMTKQDAKLSTIYILITLVKLSNQLGVYLNTDIINHMYRLVGTMNN